MIKNIKTQNGFSLIEMLLTVIIVAGLLLVVSNIIKNYGENVLAKSNANYLSQVSLAAHDIIKNPSFFSAIHGSGGNLEITLDQLRAGFTAGAITIPQSSILDDGFANFTPYKTGVNIIFRVADTGVAGSVSALEIFVSTDDRVEADRVIKSASFLGMNGGYYLNLAEGVRNAFGTWRFDPTRFNGTAWNTLVSTNPPSLADGGYIVSYQHVTFDDVSGDYLFRTRVIGRPELNQMRTNLNLGGYNILNADDINPNGALTLSDGAVVKGSMQTADSTFNQSNFYAGGTVQASSAIISGVGTGARGNLNVQGGITSSNLTTSQSIDASSATFTNGLTTNQVINVNRISQISDIQTDKINTTLFNGGASLRPSFTVGNSLKAGNLNTDSFLINGNQRTGMINLSLSGNLTGNALTSSVVVVPRLDVQNFGACDNGC